MTKKHESKVTRCSFNNQDNKDTQGDTAGLGQTRWVKTQTPRKVNKQKLDSDLVESEKETFVQTHTN